MTWVVYATQAGAPANTSTGRSVTTAVLMEKSMLTGSQQNWLREQTEPGKRETSNRLAALLSPPPAGTPCVPSSTPEPPIEESLFMLRARQILDRGRSNASSPAPEPDSSDSAASSSDEGSDIGRIRNVVIKPGRAG